MPVLGAGVPAPGVVPVPGVEAPGVVVPGVEVPGVEVPGVVVPGVVPGDVAPGAVVPGDVEPFPGPVLGVSGELDPGVIGAGVLVPGGVVPGEVPGVEVPGVEVPGVEVPGLVVPGVVVPGVVVPGVVMPGVVVPGVVVPGVVVPGVVVPGVVVVVLAHHLSSVEVAPARDCAVASFQAIQLSRAHLTRAGNLATPAKAMPSSNTSSSGSTPPLPCIRVTKSAWIAIASSTGLPITRSVSTEADAWEIEQPTASYDTSSTTPSRRCTRRVTSSPQVGLTWWTSASNGSRRPLWCGFL